MGKGQMCDSVFNFVSFPVLDVFQPVVITQFPEDTGVHTETTLCNLMPVTVTGLEEDQGGREEE